MSTKTPGVIVVLGSVTASQYERIRLDMFREGYKVRIVRMIDDDLSLYDSDDEWDDEPEEYLYSDCTEVVDPSDGMERFLERIEFATEEVVAVVALESEWLEIPEGDHAFGSYNSRQWPRLLERINLVAD